MNNKKCAFTGHRPQSLPFGFNEADERCIALKKVLRNEIINLIENKGVTHFITGMAIGVDMYAAFCGTQRPLVRWSSGRCAV